MKNLSKRAAIVVTSVYPPTEAVRTFSKMKDYQLIVVGDKKTPDNWYCNHAIYLSFKEQRRIGQNLIKFLPVNHYSRKMIGYLYAISSGFDIIIDADDDSIPNRNWLLPKFEDTYSYIPEYKGFVNIYRLFTDTPIWPRGLPLPFANRDFPWNENMTYKFSKVGIWQGLVDDDPDVDAIYRLTNNKRCQFNKRRPVVLGKGTITPVNTQNTIIRKELFPLLYLPITTTFRFTDILRGYVAQPIMWLYDFYVGCISATVIQKRNPHDHFSDFISEIPMYKHSGQIVDIISGVVTANDGIKDNLFNAYEALVQKRIVRKKELKGLYLWLKGVEQNVH